MSGFANDVVNAIGVLIRTVMKSDNYVAGSSGWAIFRNGDAEFNTGTFRGEVDIGNPPITGLIIGENIPNELVVFYNAASLADSCLLMYTDATHYYYEIAGIDHFAQTFHARGEVQAGIIYEVEYVQQGPAAVQLQFLRNGPNTNTLIFGSAGDTINAQFLHALLSLGTNFAPLGDITWHGVSMPRTVIVFERITGTHSTTAATTEQAIFTTANAYDFPNNRAFLVEVNGQVFTAGAVPVRTRVRVHKGTTIAGTTLHSPALNVLDAASTDIPVYTQNVFVNTSGASVNTKLTVSLQNTAAQIVSWDGGAGAPNPCYIRVTDIGDASLYTGASL